LDIFPDTSIFISLFIYPSDEMGTFFKKNRRQDIFLSLFIYPSDEMGTFFKKTGGKTFATVLSDDINKEMKKQKYN
jgi:hypothetical protein